MQKIDNQIAELLKSTEDKLANLKSQKSNYKTNCVIRRDQDTKLVNIQTIDTEESLVFYFGEFLIKKLVHDKACEELGVKIPLKIGGYDYEDWVGDFKIRAEKIKFSNEFNKLTNLKSRVESLVSEDQRRDMEFAKILKELGQ